MADEEKVIEKSTEKAIENVTEAADAENTEAVAAEQGEVSVTDTSVKETEDKAAELLTDKPEERPLDLIADRKVRSQPKDNIQRLKRIKQKKAQGAAAKYMAVAALTAVAVAVTAAAIGILGKNGEEAGGKMRVETVEASLETTVPPETEDQETVSIVLETTLSDEEIAEKEKEEAVTKVLDGYANLGVAEVSGFLNMQKLLDAPQQAMRLTKRAVLQGEQSTLRASLDLISSFMGIVTELDDYHKRTSALVEKMQHAKNTAETAQQR